MRLYSGGTARRLRRSTFGVTRLYSHVVATPLLMVLIIVRVAISALPPIAAAVEAEVEAEVLVAAVEEARVVEVAPSSCKGA